MNAHLPQALQIEICVHYRRDVAERYRLDVEPDPGGGIRVRRTGPMLGDTECRWLPTVPMPEPPLAEPLMRLMQEVFFGSTEPTPCILGSSDWTRVAMAVEARRNGWPEQLLHLELTITAPGCGTLARQDAGGPATTLPVRMGNEDADALFALPRMVLAGEAARRGVPQAPRKRQAEVARGTARPASGALSRSKAAQEADASAAA